MTTQSPPTINIYALKSLENSTLAKGTVLATCGAVRNLSIEGDTVTADVKGTHLYKVRFNMHDPLSGYCSCPAAEYQSFCKHAVAVALTINSGTADAAASSEREIIRDYLTRQGEEAILEKLLDYLEQDDKEWERLLTKIKLSESGVSYNDLKKLVTKALPRDHIWDWHESRAYFESAESQLEMVFDSAQNLEASQQWKLVQYVIQRLNTALGEIDDSSGDRFGIEEMINTQMPQILAKLDWSEEKKANWMFERMTSNEFDVYPSIEQHFSQVWKENATFLNLCREALENAKSDDVSSWDLQTWATPLIKTATGWREIANIKRKIARQCRDYLEITELYLKNDEPLEAEYWLAKARKDASRFELQKCDEVRVKVYVGLGEISQAWRLINRMFSESPSFAFYKRLEEFKAKHKVEDDEFLSRMEQAFIDGYQSPDYRGLIAEISGALVEFYIDRQECDKACAWVAKHKVDVNVLVKLADHIVDDKPENTLSYYLRAAACHIEQTNNLSYQQALELLQRAESLLKGHPKQLVDFALGVKSLAETYKRKRNMVGLLRSYYSEFV